jgi:hypothetical protein
MSYGHADANLLAVQALQKETARLLRALAASDPARAHLLSEEPDETTGDIQ